MTRARCFSTTSPSIRAPLMRIASRLSEAPWGTVNVKRPSMVRASGFSKTSLSSVKATGSSMTVVALTAAIASPTPSEDVSENGGAAGRSSASPGSGSRTAWTIVGEGVASGEGGRPPHESPSARANSPSMDRCPRGMAALTASHLDCSRVSVRDRRAQQRRVDLGGYAPSRPAPRVSSTAGHCLAASRTPGRGCRRSRRAPRASSRPPPPRLG